MSNPKGGMTGWRKRRDLFDLGRFLMCTFLIYAVINGVGIWRLDLVGMHTFLKWFNLVVMCGILLIISFFDCFRNNLLDYASIRSPATGSTKK